MNSRQDVKYLNLKNLNAIFLDISNINIIHLLLFIRILWFQFGRTEVVVS